MSKKFTHAISYMVEPPLSMFLEDGILIKNKKAEVLLIVAVTNWPDGNTKQLNVYNLETHSYDTMCYTFEQIDNIFSLFVGDITLRSGY